VLPLIRFRGAVRPVIIAGDRGYVERAIKAAENQLINLRARGVSGGAHSAARLLACLPAACRGRCDGSLLCVAQLQSVCTLQQPGPRQASRHLVAAA
jgi:hypothetical protein